MAEELKRALQALVETPDDRALKRAKEAWLEARRPYLQTEAYRFYAGPIDDEDGPESMINGWPMDESYIDAVAGAPGSGIINEKNIYPVISKELIASLNERAGETSITSGFHAIEFLLWGQDDNESGPGQRKVSDYIDAPNADRRGAYLLACGDLLTEHLSMLVAEWSPGNPENFRADLEKRDPATAVREILYGARTMTGKELAGERMLVAWDTQDQEDEHSCFSDTTHLDHQRDLLGIENVYRGRYRCENGETISGPGLRALVRVYRPNQLAEYDAAIHSAKTAVARIPAPFESAILGDDDAPGRRAVLDAVVKLEDFAALLARLDQIILSK